MEYTQFLFNEIKSKIEYAAQLCLEMMGSVTYNDVFDMTYTEIKIIEDVINKRKDAIKENIEHGSNINISYII